MEKAGAIILLIIALGVGLYFFNSGGAAKIGSVFQTSPTASSTTVVSATTTSSSSVASSSSSSPSWSAFVSFWSKIFNPSPYSGSNVVTISSGGSSQASSGGGGTSVLATSSIPASEVPAGFTLAQLSPYFHMIRFDGIGQSQIGLSAPGTGNVSTTIDITGWEIKTNRGGEYLPQATNIYYPSAAPILSDLILTTHENDYVYLYSNSSPINLRLNECMGFLNATHQFNPSLPSSCPQVNRSQISSFTGQCQNYILSLGCNPVNMASTQIPRNDYACQQYLENNFTYDSCLADHSTDPNFLSNQWRVWMGSSPLDKYHDNVELLDKNGLVVDTYNY